MRRKKIRIKQVVITGLLSVSLTSGVTPLFSTKAEASGKFSDLSTVPWAESSIYNLYEKEIVKGTTATTFSPSKKVTRAEFAAILSRVVDRDKIVPDFPFSDVKEDSWYYESVKKAYRMGIIKGVSDTHFAPDRPLTREEAAVIIAHTFNYSHSDQPLPYLDASKVSDWAVDGIKAVTQKQIFSGDDGYFNPQDEINRAEVAVILQKALFGSIPKPEPSPQVASVTDSHLDELLAEKVKPLLGTPYVWGGSTTKGFDCSGFTQYVYRSLGIDLPRTAGQQFGKGTPVSVNSMEPGDLIFFDTGGGSISHVGIYMGNGKMAHAASGQGEVVINTIDWYLSHYRVVGVKRYL
jgi:hypothetical protein